MKNKKRSIAVLTALACLMSGSSLVYADGAEDVAAFLNAGYDRKRATVYDGTSTETGFQMMGKTFYQGVVLDDGYILSLWSSDIPKSYISFNVEEYNSIIFTLGHIDGEEGYDAYLDIYLDDVLVYRIDCGTSMSLTRYYFDTNGAGSVRFYLDDKDELNGHDSHYGLGNIVLNRDLTAVPENAYPNYLKIIELDKSEFGDLNEDDVVDSVDASLLLAAAAAVGSGNESGLTEQLEIYADLDDSGAFDANDASTILQYAAESGTGYEGGIDDFLKR